MGLNPAYEVEVKRVSQILVAFVNDIEEVFDAMVMPAQSIQNLIPEKG